jgi:hypothetical protein
MMPNNTDFSIFLGAGYKGVNFAAVEGVEHYHQPTDNFENLNPNTAWQYLLTVNKLADYAATNTIDKVELKDDAVYFPFTPRIMVLMQAKLSRMICAATCLATLWYGIQKIKNRELRFSATTLSMGLLLVLSTLSEKLFAAGSYLFYFPLLAILTTSLSKKWQMINTIIKSLGLFAVSLLWVPALYLLNVALLQPKILKWQRSKKQT